MGNSSSGASYGCVSCVGRNSWYEDLDSYFPIRPECQTDVPKTRFKTRGIHPSIKAAVWEFLLGCFDPSSTFEERNELKQQRREKYAAWKAECQKIEPTVGGGRLMTTITDNGQNLENITVPGFSQGNNDSFDKTLIQWKLSLSQIGLDVLRTDRSLVFYENEANRAKLWDILAVYAWVDKDISYVQGMSDICSPMAILFENEADAFWCFEHAMRRLRENFKCTANSVGVQAQLNTLSQIVKTIDPKLHRHLEELDGGEYLFAFRMLMVLFRRELSFVDSLYLWEVMWAMEYNPHIYSSYVESHHTTENVKLSNKELKQYGKFERKYAKTGWTDHRNALAVFLVAAVLETKQKRLMKEARGLDDIVNIMGEVTGNLDAKKALDGALKVHEKYLNKASFIAQIVYC
nr:TBC1 domain family member 15-like [Ipomoea batatas]